MSLRENITAVIETCFSETKEEIQDTAINKILELIRADREIEPQTDTIMFTYTEEEWNEIQNWKDRMWAETIITKP